MEPLRLDNIRREQLLQMARYFYPEFPNIHYGRMYDQDEIWFSNYAYNEPYREDKPQINIELHWFEFVIRHLSAKIDEISIMDKRIHADNEILACIASWDDPIDYLWRQFCKSQDEKVAETS